MNEQDTSWTRLKEGFFDSGMLDSTTWHEKAQRFANAAFRIYRALMYKTLAARRRRTYQHDTYIHIWIARAQLIYVGLAQACSNDDDDNQQYVNFPYAIYIWTSLPSLFFCRNRDNPLHCRQQYLWWVHRIKVELLFPLLSHQIRKTGTRSSLSVAH